MILAELEAFLSRPIAPTRRIALGAMDLPCDPAPGFGGILLGGIVERFRPSIQTQQISQIADITPDDCKAVEVAMTKCSTWLPGHDKAPAARAPVPSPAELQADISALESWIGAVRKRRG